MIFNYLNNNVKKASQMQIDSIPLIKELFSTVNPIQIKKEVNNLGFNFGKTRLPLL